LRLLLEKFDDGSPAYNWLTDADVESVMRRFDTDGSGDISFEEFAVLAQDGALMRGALRSYEQAFNAVAKDGSSGLSAHELHLLLQHLGHPLELEALHQVFLEYDIDGSGSIEFGEFLRLFRNKFLDLDEIVEYMRRKSEPFVEGEEGAPSGQGASRSQPAAGQVLQLSSEAELDGLLRAAGPRLVVLQAALTWCRPCKGLQGPYMKLAAQYDNVCWSKFYGNENEHTKHLFKERLQARATPAFFFWQNGEMVHTHTGARAAKLETFVREFLGAAAADIRPLYCEQ